MSRVRVHVSTSKFTKQWQSDVTPVVRRVVRSASRVGMGIAPRGHETRAGKSEMLFRKHGGSVTRGAGLKGSFIFKNSASYADAVALGRNAVVARPGRWLAFPNRAGRNIAVKRVSMAHGNTWMAKSLRSGLVRHGLKPNVTHYPIK